MEVTLVPTTLSNQAAIQFKTICHFLGLSQAVRTIAKMGKMQVTWAKKAIHFTSLAVALRPLALRQAASLRPPSIIETSPSTLSPTATSKQWIHNLARRTT